ncbi:MAG TPA: hypothetical protein PKE69_03970 [Pyrinomonadaceae bacterium]|nr:hypothetical protein [Pyrinomonadaceae bacterium]
MDIKNWQKLNELFAVALEIAPLENAADNPDYYTAEFFSFYSKFARATART